MRRLILFIPTLILSIFVIAQKKNEKRAQEKLDAISQADLQKTTNGIIAHRTKDNASISPEYLASVYKSIALQTLDSGNYLQPFTLDLGKEIKPVTNLKLNGVQLETGTDYWPFSFCKNGFFAGTAVWGKTEANQPFLYDLKPLFEKNSNVSTVDLIKKIKDESKDLTAKKVSAIIVFNSSEIDDSLRFYANDTSELSEIPIIYFTKSGLKKLKKESTIAVAIDAQIALGERIYNGTNVLAFINNNSANTVIISSINNDNISTAYILTLAKLLKDSCNTTLKNNTYLNTLQYNNNNYLFANFSDLSAEGLGSNYFLNHLPFDISKINYAINIGVDSTPTDSIGFLSIKGKNNSVSWENILEKGNQSYISKRDSAIIYNFKSATFDKNDIPNLFLFSPNLDIQQKDNAIIINKNDIKTIQYVLQIIASANSYGKLSFNKNK